MRKTIKKYLLIGGLSIFILCACSSKEKQCQEKVKAFLMAYQEQDINCGKYLAGNQEVETVQFEGFQAILAESIKFEIESVEVNEDYDIVNVVITNVDFGRVYDGLVSSEDLQIDTTGDIIFELEKRLREKDVPKREFEVSIKMDKEQKIEMTSELSNALLGGYTQYIYELTEGGVK